MNNKEFICDIIEQWDQENCPEIYKPYKIDDYVFIYGPCGGLVIYPYSTDHLGYLWLSEDDGHYFIAKNSGKHVFWLDTDMKCIETALEYLNKNASIQYFANCEDNPDCQCGWKLPWKN